jgi:hypothetical protein
MPGPVYLARGGEQVFAQPFIAEKVQFFGFAVKADKAKLQAICDRYLNGPTCTHDFQPLVGSLFFVFNRLAKLYAKNPPDNVRGWYSEQEAAVWMLVYDSKRQKLVWYLPYILVDSSYAMAMGREIYGFPKEFGWFDIPDGPAAPTSMKVETVVVEKLDPNCQAQQKPLFAAQRANGGTSATPDQPLRASDQLTRALVEGLRVADDVAPAISASQLQQLLSVPIPMVFLKQFRDGVQPAAACFQSVQEVPIVMTRFYDARLYFHRYEIVFQDWASHPLRSDLGLAAGPLPVQMAYWAMFDFEIGTCTEVWRAPT